MYRPASLIALLTLAAAPLVHAQEFACEVMVNDRQISGIAHDHVSNLEQDIGRYINENRWTDDRFEDYERIRCDIRIVLTDADSQFNYTAEVVFTVRRPINGSAHETPSLIVSDNSWSFSYPPNRSLIYDRLQFDDLVSFIDFYAFVMLGYDYDSFSELGGSYFYRQALEILEMAQNSNTPGWGRSIGTQRTRYGLINDLTSQGFEEVRLAVYQYHRLGLDLITSDPEEGRSHVLEAIDRIRNNRERVSRYLLFDTFFDAKYVEIVSLFLDADPSVRLEAYHLLRETDPGHTGEYERLR